MSSWAACDNERLRLLDRRRRRQWRRTIGEEVRGRGMANLTLPLIPPGESNGQGQEAVGCRRHKIKLEQGEYIFGGKRTRARSRYFLSSDGATV